MGEWVAGRDGSTRAWRARRAWWQPHVDTGTVACARCGDLIAPGSDWHLDHFKDNDRDEDTAPSHVTCNLRAGSARSYRRRADRIDAQLARQADNGNAKHAVTRDDDGPVFPSHRPGRLCPDDALSPRFRPWSG